MSEKPIEVVIRNPKWTLRSATWKLAGSIAGTALITWLLMLTIPAAASIFGVEANPNFGETLLLLLTVRFLTRPDRVWAYGSDEKNEF